MELKALYLEQFRNYEDLKAEFSPEVNVITGDNAQGKTNLLESIAFLSTAKSFRAKKEEELIRFGENESRIRAAVFSRQRELSIEARIFRGPARRQLYLNGVKLKKAGELSGSMHTVLFSPDDLYLIREGANIRRKFMDTALCQLRPRYAALDAEYARLYEHKKRILRDFHEKPGLLNLLDDFNERMAKTGAVIISYRARFIKKLSEEAAKTHLACSDGKEELFLSYKTVSTIQDPFAETEILYRQIMEHQKNHRQAELDSRNCLTGPHKDDFETIINGKAAKSFASQGQTRTAALSIKLAEREIHRADMDEYPILLLDDVLSELDKNRQDFVLNRIAGGQVFITCCGNDRLETLNSGKVFHIVHGSII